MDKAKRLRGPQVVGAQGEKWLSKVSPTKSPKPDCCSLCSHEEHAKHLTDSCEATRVDLANVYRIRLEELLEYYPVMRVLSGRNADPLRFQRVTDGCVSKDVIRRRGLLNEPRQTKGARAHKTPVINLLERRKGMCAHHGLISASEDT